MLLCRQALRLLPGLAVVSLSLSAGCGEDTPPPLYGDSPSLGPNSTTMPKDCSSPCACPDRGPPDFTREMSGKPTAGADDHQTTALLRANHWRTAAGLVALDGNAKIQQAADAHARYMAGTAQGKCWPGAHDEHMNCAGFTGAGPGERMTAAGYKWMNAGEVINWEGDATAAIDRWLWSVYHRMPFVDYTLLETGYAWSDGMVGGHAGINNVMDFGTGLGGSAKAPSAPAVIPLPGQLDVPTGFRGDLEGPTPPGPKGMDPWPSGLESGQVISMHFAGSSWKVTDHHLYSNAGGACTEVMHTFISRDNDMNLQSFMANDVFMYADQSLAGATEYVVVMTGTFNSKSFTRSWAFTTH